MKLVLQRQLESPECIIGILYLDGLGQCVTLELPSKLNGAENVPDKTCIPENTYTVLREYSHRFAAMMPSVQSVPGREGILIHPGNTAADTEGCILVGEVRLSDTMIGESKAAFAALNDKLEDAWGSGEAVTLEIKPLEAE